MQTLTVVSFLNLENAEGVEQLNFTARRLAEHTATVAKAEELTAAALENLAPQLWDKAEYVARDVERRRLREIFAENFCERFREIKPEYSPAENSVSEVVPEANAIGNTAGLIEPSPDTEIIESESGECSTAKRVSSISPPELEATEVQGKRDEFLGFVITDD